MLSNGPIGIFDSGYGGLTVMREIVKKMPAYDYLYLGDNARAPYGSRSYETIYAYTKEAVLWFFRQGCPLVILACNTASAKALRTIQQLDLPQLAPDRRVLGVIRPTAEIIGKYTITRQVGVLGTTGTINSFSYPLEIKKFYPDISVFQQACPMWVPLIENNEYDSPGADYFVHKCIDQLLTQSRNIDAILLACTHYPLLADKIRLYLPSGVTLLCQGDIVAERLQDYLKRHTAMEQRIIQRPEGGDLRFFTTDSPLDFDLQANKFFGQPVKSQVLKLTQ
jgi:glutamate racemase